ncbi:hypothetical protein DCC81_16545 [Chitinophaga parva]|uniref:Uncharacterized protein n=1 Tax=Chitinophaga parva TaxID=2169414 RepID=A0A2T7BHV1_9BACT|nr:hypothetical protein [Chitinophaga parva]PUZ25860.1 hypothetical protein DCC81_16545 [Chitinophaga parva]
MKSYTIIIAWLLFTNSLFAQTTFKAWEQQITKDCTNESVQKEPSRFWDAHIGGAIGGGKEGYTSTELANAKKMMTAFENVCKPKMQFSGGLVKASFGLNSKSFYNRTPIFSYTYNMGFHQYVCNVQTHKLSIVDEYQGVLRITGNPSFQTAFPRGIDDRSIAVYSYCAFSDNRLVNAINNGSGFIDLNSEETGNTSLYPIVEYKPGKGYGISFPNSGFVAVNNDFVFHHAFITHPDIPFFIPITRKQFLTDLLEFYDREKPSLVANMQDNIKQLSKTIAESEKTNSRYLQDQKSRQALQQQSANDIPAINEQKKQTVTKLLQSKDEKWLNQQAVIPGDNKAFIVPSDRNRNLKEVYGDFYFTEFYTGTEGLKLYQINPEYLKKYPPNGAKPSLIDVMYRFQPNNKFLMGIKESSIDQLDLNEFRKLLQ